MTSSEETIDFNKAAESYAEEIRLSRELMRALERCKWSINKDAYGAYRALLQHYEQQIEEDIQ